MATLICIFDDNTTQTFTGDAITRRLTMLSVAAPESDVIIVEKGKPCAHGVTGCLAWAKKNAPVVAAPAVAAVAAPAESPFSKLAKFATSKKPWADMDSDSDDESSVQKSLPAVAAVAASAAAADFPPLPKKGKVVEPTTEVVLTILEQLDGTGFSCEDIVQSLRSQPMHLDDEFIVVCLSNEHEFPVGHELHRKLIVKIPLPHQILDAIKPAPTVLADLTNPALDIACHVADILQIKRGRMDPDNQLCIFDTLGTFGVKNLKDGKEGAFFQCRAPSCPRIHLDHSDFEFNEVLDHSLKMLCIRHHTNVFAFEPFFKIKAPVQAEPQALPQPLPEPEEEKLQDKNWNMACQQAFPKQTKKFCLMCVTSLYGYQTR
jgi:hypothetical protein